MWSKLTGSFKRPVTPAHDTDTDDDRAGPVPAPSVLAAVFDQHPNLSNFREAPPPLPGTEVPFPTPSPPPSPSKGSTRRSLFKRVPKTWGESRENLDQAATLPVRIPGPLKKVKSSLNSISTASSEFSSRASTDSAAPRQSQDSARSPIDYVPSPNTPTTEGRFGSLRSILRDKHTPGTGASVRFFSRDAYKVITPDVSDSSARPSEPDPESFTARIKVASSTPTRPPLQDVFSPPSSSLSKPLPPTTDESNLFDLSQEIDLPPIPISKDAPLLDSAIEITSDADMDGHGFRSEAEGDFRSSTPSARPSSNVHDRSQSFSFGQTVFHSLANGGRESPLRTDSPKPGGSFKRKANRSRAYSDTVFHSFIGTPGSAQKDTHLPEADINDTSGGALVVYDVPASPPKEKDPFGAYSTAYYTPGTGVPPTPPQNLPAHGRKASREEDLILSLRTQLAMQTELSAQYEIDLGARDEQLRMVQAKLSAAEQEMDKRKHVMRSWRKRVQELEKCVRMLEEEVGRSREESMERSMMDEASSDALRALHRRVQELEREKSTLEKRERRAEEELRAKEEALASATLELSRRDESERELRDGIAAARDQIDQLGEVSMVLDAERSRVYSTAVWDEERTALRTANEALRTENFEMQGQLADAREEVVRRDSEMEVLKAELEAQWRSTEQQTEKIQALTSERDALKAELDALHDRISGMEEDWNQTENRKNELEAELQEVWAAKEDAEKERVEFEDQLRGEQEHTEELTRALQEREDRVSALEQERKFASDNVSRLEARLAQREAEMAEVAQQMSVRENEAEEAHSEMAKMKREHARIVNEQSRTLQDVVAREVEARAGMEAMVREKAEADVALGTLKERSESLKDEVERLRRQVHELQQESADKEVKLAHFAKQRAQDKEDLNGLNIALDSKQQELELLKRRIGVRGTAGGTPAPAAKAAPAARRESSIFGTPSVSSRPPSVLSDSGSTTKDQKRNVTPSTITKPALGKSIRANGPVHAAKRSLEGAMGPPPSALSRASSASAVSATPTRIPSGSSNRLSQIGVPTPTTVKATTAAQRRMSASILDPSSKLRTSTSTREKLEKLPSLPASSEPDEKENSLPAAKAARRMSAMPA